MKIEFLAKSSSQPEPYTVSVNWINGKLSANCNCAAGENGLLCKHKLSILSNDLDILFDKRQEKDLHKITKWVESTALPKLLIELENAEKEKDFAIKEAKDKFSKIKHKISRLIGEGI